MSAPVVATVQAVVGNVIAVNQDGDIRVLKAGDALFQGETIKTAPEGSVTIVYATGASQTIGADANFTLHLSLLSFIAHPTALAHMDPTAVAFRTALLADSDPKKVFAAFHGVQHEGDHSAYVRPYIDSAVEPSSGYPTQGLGSTPTFSSNFVLSNSPSQPDKPTWDEPMYTPPLTVSAPISFGLNEAGLPNGSHPDVSETTVSQTFSFYAGSDALTRFAFSSDLSNLTTDLNNNASPDIFWARVSDTQIKGFLDAGHNQLAITLDLQAPASIDAWGEGDAQVTATLSNHLSHAAGNGAQIGDLGAIQVTASDGVDTVTVTLLLGVQDDVPTAVNDTGSVTEDGASSIGGNVLDNDSAGADAPKSFASWGSEDGVAIAALNVYGTLTQNNDGSWSYVLDNSRAVTQALTNTDSHDYVLHYTMQDADGDTSEATLTITTHGTDDSASLATLSATGVDGTVYEHGLVTHDDSQTTVNGSFSVSASDGIHDVVIGGTTFNWEQIQAFNGTQTVNTSDGILTLTSYSGTATNGTIYYSYTLPAAVSNDSAGYFDDNIALAVNGIGGSTASDSLVIHIVDDSPAAINDNASVTEDGTSNIGGNVLSNDSAGADAPAVFVAWGDSDSAAISALNTYGTLTQNNNGSWSYVLDNSRSATQALTSANTLNYDLHYSIQDADGSISSAKLTITVQGADDGSSVTTAQASGPDGTVLEHGLVAHDGTQTVTGSFIITASDNIASVTIGGNYI